MNSLLLLLLSMCQVAIASDLQNLTFNKDFFDEDFLKEFQEQSIFDSDELKHMEKRSIPYVGIPVPGQQVTSLDIMDLFTSSCRPHSSPNDQFQPTDIVQKSLNLLSSQRGEQFSQVIYRNLFMTLGEVDMDKLMGKWYKVVDSPTVHRDACSVSKFEMLHKSQYLATFSVKESYRENGPKGDWKLAQGYGTKIGPDPGEFQLHTGHDSDPCPFLLVKTGPLDKHGNYDYLIFSQLLKHPVMVYARDPEEFELFYKQEVSRYLETQNFLNPLTKAYNMVAFMDYRDCPKLTAFTSF